MGSHLAESPTAGGRTHLDHPLQNTNDTNRDRAFESLRRQFPNWQAVRDADPGAIVAAIRTAGLANQKGPRIQQVLKDISAERGSLDLGFLQDLPLEEARAWLMKFKGVGPKTAAIVLLFSLSRPAFPVDTHIYRVTGRIGLRPEKMTVEEAHFLLEKIFPPEAYYAAHLNIIRLGREICAARKPACQAALCADFAIMQRILRLNQVYNEIVFPILFLKKGGEMDAVQPS